jgi:hypothetical protein
VATQIRGTVVDAARDPVGWATVWFASGDHPTPDIAAVTDDDGRFSLTAPAPGTYRIGCRAEGHDVVETDVRVTTDDVEITITLTPT